jgi:hypothetical protein
MSPLPEVTSPPHTPVATEPNSLVMKLEFRFQTKETPSVYAAQAKTIIMKIMSKFSNEAAVCDNQEKEIQHMDSTFSNYIFNQVSIFTSASRLQRPRKSNIATLISFLSPLRPPFKNSQTTWC